MAFADAFYIHGLEGMENTKALTEQFNGMLFEYGIHDVFFKITKQGFERIEGIQEVKAFSYYSASETTVKRSFTCFGFSISSSAATAKSS